MRHRGRLHGAADLVWYRKSTREGTEKDVIGPGPVWEAPHEPSHDLSHSSLVGTAASYYVQDTAAQAGRVRAGVGHTARLGSQ